MSVTPSKSRLIFIPKGSNQTVDVTYTGGETYEDPVIEYDGHTPGWLEIVGELIESDEVDIVRYTLTTEAWGASDTRKATITFEDQTGTNQIEVYQVGSYYSLWWDNHPTRLPGATGSEYVYRLKDHSDDEIFFEGITNPNLTDANIARVVEDMVYSDTPDYDVYRTEEWFELPGSIIVDLYKVETQLGVPVEIYKDSYGYWNDWSYLTFDLYNHTGRIVYLDNTCLNDPINNKGSQMMDYYFCVYTADDSTAGWKMLEYKTGGATRVIDSGSPEAPFSKMLYRPRNLNYDVIKINFMTALNRVLFSYNLGYCGQGALYYRNRFGGFDSFLIEGNIRRVDSYTRENYRPGNRLGSTGSNVKFTDRTNITAAYEVTTGWLTDEESKRLVYHLLPSPTVKLQIFNEGYGDQAFSVNITSSSAEYKKFRNGRKLVQYTILLEDSREYTSKC